MTNFQLQPFSRSPELPAIEIGGKINRIDRLLAIEYQLSGDLHSIELASPKPSPQRTFALWEDTCFEFFLGIPGAKNYWEFNLSPSGDWNIFHLDDYRQGLLDELAFTVLPFTVDRQPNSLLLALEFDLSNIIAVEQAIEISITTVIKPVVGDPSYWALTHCGLEPDFHRRDSFVMRI